MGLLQPPQSAARRHPRWWRETRHGAPGRWRASLWRVEVEVISLVPLLFMPLYLVSSLLFFVSCYLFLKQTHASCLFIISVGFLHPPHAVNISQGELKSCVYRARYHSFFISSTVMTSCSKFQRKWRGQSNTISWLLSILMLFSEVPYITESWSCHWCIIHCHFFSWHLIGLISFSTHMFYTSVSMTEKIIQYICCFVKHYITVIHQAFCRTWGITFSVTCGDLALPSRAWYWNTMTEWSPPDYRYDAVTRQACGLPPGLNPAQQPPETSTPYCLPGIFIVLSCNSWRQYPFIILYYRKAKKSQ